jgi:hypothetical protein
MNVTVPVGVKLVNGELTVAVRGTDCPYTEGFGELTRTVVVGAMTVCPRVARLGKKLVSPLYLATIVCRPGVSDDVEKVATFALTAPVPKDVAPSKKLTVPVGPPFAGLLTTVIVAVKVTDEPWTDGFALEASARVVVPFVAETGAACG